MSTEHGSGPKYHIDIEGTLHPWDTDAITTEQIIDLAGWPNGQAVLLIDADNNERQLSPGEKIDLKPGMGFAKKVRFRRGA